MRTQWPGRCRALGRPLWACTAAFPLQISSSRSSGSGFVASGADVIASAGVGRESKERIAVGAPASSGPLQVADSDDGLAAVVVASGWVVFAAVVGAGGAECSHGGGVAAALGSEVAAVAEHVGPAAQGLEVLVWVVAELPGGEDEP